MVIPFTKAHGAANDFLLTWDDRAPKSDLPAVARAICGRNTGIGADGWILINPRAIRLFNADGTEAEISGNGTRCAAAMLVEAGLAGETITLMTGAGPKTLRLIVKRGPHSYLFEMDMGQPLFREEEVRFRLDSREVTILNVGNPQCVVFVDDFPAGWRETGCEMEAHSHFPKHTNVSFVRVLDEHSVEARFYERGVGPTVSSGTGSTGAAVAAILRRLVKTPVRIITPAGDLVVRWDESVYLTGPAEILGTGEFFYGTSTSE
ncbi:MAG: diaminopimelate epimerase [Bryobacteraceae bacterium]